MSSGSGQLKQHKDAHEREQRWKKRHGRAKRGEASKLAEKKGSRKKHERICELAIQQTGCPQNDLFPGKPLIIEYFGI